MVNNIDIERALENFQKKYTTNEKTGCWEWSGALDPGGYGVFCVPRTDGTFKNMRAHKFSYELGHHEVPKDMVLRHRCHVRNCVNPEHLLLGTNLQNQQDRSKRVKKANKQYEEDLAWLMDTVGIKSKIKAHRLALRLLRRTISDNELKKISDAVRIL